MRASQTIFRSFVLCSFIVSLTGCPISGGTGGNGNGTDNVGGTSTPPGDQGTTASSLLENPLSSICATLSGKIYMGSSGGKLLISSDGATVTVLNSTKVDVDAAHCDQQTSAAENVWFVGPGGTILYYDGSTINTQTSGTTHDLHGVFGTSTSDLYTVGDAGVILRNGGSGWALQTSGTAETLYGVGGKVSELLAVGSNKTVITSLNSGATWSAVGSLPSDVLADTQLNAVWMDPLTSEVFVVGNAGTIMHRNSSLVWSKQSAGTSANLVGVSGSSTSRVFAIGAGGVLLAYDGANWTKQTNPNGTTFNMTGVLATSSSAFAVGAKDSTASATGSLLKFVSSAWLKLL